MSFSDALAELFVLILVSAIGLPAGAQSVTTSQYDNARSGASSMTTRAAAPTDSKPPLLRAM